MVELLNEEEKDKRFQDKMKQLELKKQLKNHKKLERAKNRAIFQKNHKYLSIIATVSTLSIFAIAGYYAYNTINELYANYHNTLKWEKKSSIELASIDPETLYATKEDKELRESYLSIVSEIWNRETHQFNDNVTPEKVEDLTKKYELITSSKESLSKEYDEITTMWLIKQKLDNLFVDGSNSHQVLRRESTLKMISETLSSSYELISQYLIDDKYQLAHLYYVEISGLVDETYKLNQLITEFDSSFERQYSGKKLQLKTELTDVGYQRLNYLVDQLSYDWEIVNDVIKPILEKSSPVVSLNEAELLAFNSYLSDVEEKESFESYLEKYSKIKEEQSSKIVKLHNFVGMTKEEAEVQSRADSINLTYRYEQTSDKSKHNLVSKQSVDVSKYKSIVKNSTIELTIYEYVPTNVSNGYNNYNNSNNSNNYNNSNNSNNYNNSDIINSFNSNSTSSYEPAARIE